jgi:phospholipid/cholesterol/gamma-HCH transport system substrate-binding protein
MYPRYLELLVGCFLVAAIAALGVLAVQVSGLSLKPAGETYKVYAQFDDLGGLTLRAKVSLAGVTIGRVSNISLDKKKYVAVVEMEINKDVNDLTTDSIASIQTAGLLGEKYISISVGADQDYLHDGDTIFDTQSALNIEKLISNFASKFGK